MEHELQPKNIKILTPDEIRDVVTSIAGNTAGGLAPTPRIDPDDPIAKFLGLQLGDMYKAEYHSPTAGITYRYRICAYS